MLKLGSSMSLCRKTKMTTAARKGRKRKMASKEEKPAALMLEDGNPVIFGGGSGGVVEVIDEGRRLSIKDGKSLDIRVGTDRIFVLSGHVTITPSLSDIIIKGSDIQFKMGDKLITVSKGNIFLFDDMGYVEIKGEGITVKHGDTTLSTQKGSATAYRPGSKPLQFENEVEMDGHQIHATVGNKLVLVFVPSTARRGACAGTTSGGGFKFIEGIMHEPS